MVATKGTDMEQKIKEIYNKCAKSFLQYTKDHNMSEYNVRQSEIIDEYNGKPGAEFCQDILYAFAKAVNDLHKNCKAG